MIRKKTYKHKKEYYFIVNNKNDFQLESKQKLPVNDKMLQKINKTLVKLNYILNFT